MVVSDCEVTIGWGLHQHGVSEADGRVQDWCSTHIYDCWQGARHVYCLNTVNICLL